MAEDTAGVLRCLSRVECSAGEAAAAAGRASGVTSIGIRVAMVGFSTAADNVDPPSEDGREVSSIGTKKDFGRCRNGDDGRRCGRRFSDGYNPPSPLTSPPFALSTITILSSKRRGENTAAGLVPNMLL